MHFGKNNTRHHKEPKQSLSVCPSVSRGHWPERLLAPVFLCSRLASATGSRKFWRIGWGLLGRDVEIPPPPPQDGRAHTHTLLTHTHRAGSQLSQDRAPGPSSNRLHNAPLLDAFFFPSHSPTPTPVFWDHLPNELLALGLSPQGVPLREPKSKVLLPTDGF